MVDDDTFLAAYVLLLARLWQELESLWRQLQSPAVSEEMQLHAEIFRLELVLLQQSLQQPRLSLRGAERARIRSMIDRLLAGVDVQPGTAQSSMVAIADAQDLLFEEVCDLLKPADSLLERHVA